MYHTYHNEYFKIWSRYPSIANKTFDAINIADIADIAAVQFDSFQRISKL